MTLDETLKRSPDAAFRIYEGKATIVLPSQSSVHVMNPTGSFIWDHLDGRTTLAQILDRVVEEFEIEREEAEADLKTFVGALLEQGMVS